MVRLSLQDDFTSGVAKAAAMTAVLNRELNSLSGQAVRSSRSTRVVAQDTDHVARSAGRADDSINHLTGRLRLMADVAAILGPALVPIGALAIPALAGLANQFGAAALAGGTAILAFQGVGDALKAVNEARLDPTAENLDKAREALEELSPAAAAAVVRLQELRPVLKGLRDEAAEGLMPGVVESIDELETRVPELERILRNVGQAAGDMLAEGAAGLASERWDEFFDFLATEAPQTLTQVARTTGALAHGLAELWMAFDPLNDDFGDWLLDAATGFDRWAEGLSRTEGFREFIDYIRTQGPQVADTFAAMGDAVLQIVQAAAPIGGPVLASLEALLRVVARIADSDLGTPIMAAAAATALWSRSTLMLERAGQTAWGARAKTNVGGMVGALTQVTSAQERATMSVAQHAQAERNRASAIRSGLGTMGRAAGVVGGLAVVTSGAADDIGLANTASLALLGTFAGPWGTAVGAAAGAAMDFRAANDAAREGLEGLGDVIRRSPSDFDAQAAAYERAAQSVADYAKSAESANPAAFFAGLGGVVAEARFFQNAIEGIFGTSEVEEQRRALAEHERQMEQNKRVVSDLGNLVSGDHSWTDYTGDLERLNAIVESTAPALAHMKMSWEDLATMREINPLGFQAIAAEIREYIAEADSVPGRTRAVADAIKDLDNGMLSTAESADQLSSALDALLSPGLNAEEAADELTNALNDMHKALKNGEHTFKGNSKAAMENREATRGAFEATIELLTAMAERGDGPRRLAQSLADARRAFIEEGEAAGFSRKQMVARANAMGLTPKLVRTVFQAAGIDAADRQLRNLRRSIDRLPKNVRTRLRQEGFSLSNRQIETLRRKYDLTPRQVRTLLLARDNASRIVDRATKRAKKFDGSKYAAMVDLTASKFYTGASGVEKRGRGIDKQKISPTVDANPKPALGKFQNVERAGRALGNQRYTPTVDANTSPAQSALAGIRAALNSIPDETVYVNVVRRGGSVNADGGVHTFSRYPRIGDQWPQVRPYTGPAGITWSEEGSGPWEGFVSGHPAKVGRSRTVTTDIVHRLGGEVIWKAADGLLLETFARRPAPVSLSPAVMPIAATPAAPVSARLHPADVRALAAALQEGARSGAATGIAQVGDHSGMLGRGGARR